MADIHIKYGFVNKPPELKTSKDGQTQWAEFTLGWSDSRKDRAGQWENGPTKWIRVKAFGELANIVMNHVFEKTKVDVQGRIEHFEWQSNNGPKDDWQLMADFIAPSKQKQQSHSTFNHGVRTTQPDPWNSQPTGGFGNTDDEPPF